MTDPESRRPERLERFKTLSTLILGASIPLFLDEVLAMYMLMADPIHEATAREYVSQAAWLLGVLLLGLLSYRSMRTLRPPRLPWLLLLLAIFWLGVLV